MQNIIGVQPVSSTTASLNIDTELDAGLNSPIDRGFDDLIAKKVDDIDSALRIADQAMVSYINGEDIPTHEVIIAMGKAKSELQLALEIRNKLVDSYKEIARMQV